MWPLGTLHPQQKTGTPLSVGSSQGLWLGRVIHSQYQLQYLSCFTTTIASGRVQLTAFWGRN